MRLKKLNKKFKDKVIFANSEITLYEGFSVIYAPSGAGKSTLLKILAGKDKSASFEIEGATEQDYEKMIDSTAFVFQNFSLIEETTVEKNVLFWSSKKKIDKELNELLVILQIEHLLKRKVTQISSGERQRVAMARALATNPKIILCDEPTANLDRQNKDMIYQMMKDLSEKGVTILMVCHDSDVFKFCDNIYQLKNKEIIAYQTSKNELSNSFESNKKNKAKYTWNTIKKSSNRPISAILAIIVILFCTMSTGAIIGKSQYYIDQKNYFDSLDTVEVSIYVVESLTSPPEYGIYTEEQLEYLYSNDDFSNFEVTYSTLESWYLTATIDFEKGEQTIASAAEQNISISSPYHYEYNLIAEQVPIFKKVSGTIITINCIFVMLILLMFYKNTFKNKTYYLLWNYANVSNLKQFILLANEAFFEMFTYLAFIIWPALIITINKTIFSQIFVSISVIMFILIYTGKTIIMLKSRK